jgi:hypothetical protein
MARARKPLLADHATRLTRQRSVEANVVAISARHVGGLQRFADTPHCGFLSAIWSEEKVSCSKDSNNPPGRDGWRRCSCACW